MIKKVSNFLKLPLSSQLRWFSTMLSKLKGVIFYKIFFKSFGKNSYIQRPLLLTYEAIDIGDDVKIFEGARIEAIKNQKFGFGMIEIGSGTSIEQRVHMIAGGNLIIGRNCLISFDVMITDTDHKYSDRAIKIADQNLVINETHIGDNCFIGAGVKIQAGTKLGRHCVVGANAVVRGVFPDCSVIVGIPARIVKRFNPESNLWEKTDPQGNFLIQS